MNKDDIKKALEVCTDCYSTCDDCPYADAGNCGDTLKTDACELIVEQENEIERLKDDYAKLQEQFAQYQMASDKEIMAQKKQTVKEFADKVKAKSYVNDYCREVVEIDKIDELLKEYE